MTLSQELKAGVTVALVLVALAVIPARGAAQNVTGTVVGINDKGGVVPLEGIPVIFLDGHNGELVAATLTVSDGSFDSGLIPPGDYRVRFGPGSAGTGSVRPEIFGAAGENDYCGGSIVSVFASSTTTGVDAEMPISGPVEVVAFDGDIAGTVSDGVTGLDGITVTVFDAVNAYVITELVTERGGQYTALISRYPGHHTARVRFSDPASMYFPQFFGAGGDDDFCTATALDFAEGRGQAVADAVLELIPPGQQTENLIDAVNDLDAPDEVITLLASPLVKAADLVTDANPNNDSATCAQLAAFITRVDIEERRGQISAADATELRLAAEAVRLTLGCG